MSIHKLRGIFVVCAVLLAGALFGLPARAQQLQTRPAQDQAQNQSQPAVDTPKIDEGGGTDDRLFWTLPNFMTVENAKKKIAPLTTAQKFKLVARTSFDPVQFPYFAFLAGIDQAENSEAGYGQGAVGYAKRFGSNVADGTTENFFVGAIFPSLFREDPRYFQDGKGPFLHRAAYAMSRIALTRSDGGHTVVNISEFAGAGAAAAISNTYHPAADRTAANTVSTWASLMGWDMVSNVVKEFWPDIRRKVHASKG